MSNKKRLPQPPQPPRIKVNFQLPLIQRIGIPLMMLIPILALFGLFGETTNAIRAANPQLEMRVEYPTRFRYKMIDAVQVSLFNTSEQTIPTVTVRFDRAYIDQFSTATFTPSVKSITEDSYIVEITDLLPDETRVISVSIQAEEYGWHEGSVTAVPEGSDGIHVQLNTVTFP